MRLILGAGCSGLGLATALVDAGVREPIVLLDRRSEYANDRTWCFWAGDGHGDGPGSTRRAGGEQGGRAMLGPVHHTWHRWRFVARDGTVREQSSARHPYVQVRGDAFYEQALERLAASPQVEVRLGERVVAVEDRVDRLGQPPGVWAPGRGAVPPCGAVALRTARGETILADHVYDAMGGGGPLAAGRPDGAIELKQSFLGLEIETARPTFDPAVATLMDFRTGPRRGPGSDGLHFIYVLPTSPTRALVEHTTLGPSTVAPAARRDAIAVYLAEHVGVGAAEYEVLREERGVLPMSTHRFPVSHGPRVDVVGAAAGAVRPSSGYAFVRIGRHVAAVARAAAAGEAAPRRVGPAKTEVLDRLFLRALAVDPPGFDRTLLALAARTSGDTFARFMSDRSTARDDAAVMASLARPGFLWPMAASSLLRPIARPAA